MTTMKFSAFGDFMLKERFRTMREMVHVLEIYLLTLQYNFKNIAVDESACIAISYLLAYRCEMTSARPHMRTLYRLRERKKGYENHKSWRDPRLALSLMR